MVLRYLGFDFFCSSHALTAVISSVAFVSEGHACVIATVTVPQPAVVCNPGKQISRSRRDSAGCEARKLDSSSAEFWSETLLWRPYSSCK